MRAREYVYLVVLSAIWGLSYVFIQVASPLLGPALLMDLRVLVAAGVVLAYVTASGELRRRFPDLRRRWKAYFLLGAVNAAIPFTLIAFSELELPASYAALLNSTAPIFSTVIAVSFLSAYLSRRTALGLLLGIVGVATAVGVAPFPLTTAILFAVALALAAACSYGFAALYLHREFRDTPPITISIGQQLAAGALLLPFALVELPNARFTWLAVGAMLGLALLSTVIAYLLYFHILQAAGPTQALTVTFLMPIFGVLWGHLLLGEPIGVGTVVGLALILVGVQLVVGFGRDDTQPPGETQLVAEAALEPGRIAPSAPD
jgi:drug/metabolite transporter (DMT)-like permease